MEAVQTMGVERSPARPGRYSIEMGFGAQIEGGGRVSTSMQVWFDLLPG